MKEVKEREQDRMKALAEANARAAEMVVQIQKLNEELRLEKEKAETYLDLVGVIVVALDINGNIKLLNKKGHEVLGYNEGELLGKNWFDACVSPMIKKELLSVFRKLLSGKIEPVEYYEYRVLTKTGEERIISWHNTIIRDSTGKTKSTLSAGEDITERKRMEEALKETQKKLLHSERLATIGQLAAILAHELRHPLGILQNSAYFLNLRMKDDDEKVKRHLATMKNETLRADGIISALLDFSRKIKSHFAPTNLNQIIEETLSKIAVHQGVEVVRELGDVPPVFADPGQLTSVFFHLIFNGIQAMPGGGTLIVKTSQEDEFVEVRVSDTGVGIAKKNLERIFEPLFSTKSFGVGLGLCIAKKLIENHGGIIKVESEPNAGSTFIIRLPIERRKRP